MHPTGQSHSDISATKWLDSLSDEDEVDIKFPYEKHGLHRKPSNHSKPAVRDALLQFVDNNIQPNGRQAGSYSAQYYFIPKFTRIDPPKVGEKDFDTKAHASVVWTFNQAQQERGEQTCSAFAARQWIKENRPKVSLHPHKSDYCDTCKGLKEEISRQSAIFKRLMQAGSTPEHDLRLLQSEISTVEQTLSSHKEEAASGREYYNTVVAACATNWEKIMMMLNEENPTPDTLTELATAQHTFTLVLSADYQQSKLIPHWGRTEQPGSTYYLQKASYDIFGIVDHRNEDKSIILFDETVGPKNTDHTISLLSQYISQVVYAYPWIKRVCIFLDNAGSTNKNRYLFSWAMEVVEGDQLDHFRFCFLLAGHTKFAPDRLFSLVANEYKREDTFTAEELRCICQKFGSAHIEDGANILPWRASLVKKYSELPGVRKLHDFVIVRSGDKVVMKVRDSCCKGSVVASPLHVVDPSVSTQPTSTYRQSRKELPGDKLAHLKQMYSKFVPPDRWPDYILTALQVPSSHPAPATTSSNVAQSLVSSVHPNSRRQPVSNPPPAKKRKSCTTKGCDGSGHRNKQRWNEGHNTKAGCPRIPR
jgi:hypothetical protein